MNSENYGQFISSVYRDSRAAAHYTVDRQTKAILRAHVLASLHDPIAALVQNFAIVIDNYVKVDQRKMAWESK